MSTITELVLTDDQLRDGVKGICATPYGRGGGLDRDRQNGDVDLAVKNLTALDLSHVAFASAISAVVFKGTPVDPRPDSWNDSGKDLRDFVVRQFVKSYFDL